MSNALPLKVRAVVTDVRTGGDAPLVVLEPVSGGKIELRVPARAVESFELGDEWNVYLSRALEQDEIEARVEEWTMRPAQNEAAAPLLAS